MPHNSLDKSPNIDWYPRQIASQLCSQSLEAYGFASFSSPWSSNHPGAKGQCSEARMESRCEAAGLELSLLRVLIALRGSHSLSVPRVAAKATAHSSGHFVATTEQGRGILQTSAKLAGCTCLLETCTTRSHATMHGPLGLQQQEEE